MADDVVGCVFAWALDGVSKIIVSDEQLDDAWAVASGFVSTHVGLEPPTSLACGTDLRSGLLADDTATLHVRDVDGTLVSLFRASKADRAALIDTLEPGDTGGSQVKGKHVGTEFIAAVTGARRQYSCIPGFSIGAKHYGQNEAYANGLEVTWVSSNPLQMEGRRCALYLVKHVNGAWQTLSQAKRLWWGQIRGRGDYKSGRWSFNCFGPQSWLAPTLGRGKWQEGIRAVPDLAIDSENGIGEHILYGALEVMNLDNREVLHEYGDTSVFKDDDKSTGYLVGADSYSDVAAAINTFLDDIVSDGTNGDPFDANADGNDIYVSTETGLEGITIIWKRGDTTSIGDPYVDAGDSPRLCCLLRLWAHEKVWRTLGYDPRLQNSDRDPVANEDQYGQFQEVVGMPGYWQGAFYSASPKAMLGFETGDFSEVLEQDYSHHGDPRAWPPLYPGGAVTFTGEPGQEFYIATNDALLLSSSKSRPLLADPDDETQPYTIGDNVGTVDAQAVLVLEGPYRRRGDEDQVDPVAGYAFEIERERREGRTVQVVRVNFKRNADGTVAAGANGYPRFVIQQWYDPRLFGFDYKPLQGTWGAFRDPPDPENAINATPISVWDARDSGDKISEVLQRVMLTTGTGGGWYSDEALTTPLYGLGGESAHFDVGDNDSGGAVPKDAEDATLGLAIPESMVASPAAFDAVEGALGPNLRRCKVAAHGSLSARDLFARLLSPTGLALGLSGGKYGIFDSWSLPAPGDAVLSITSELYGGQPGKPESTIPQQALRQWAAIDSIEVSARIDPITKDYHVQLERAASDGGACYRGQHLKHRIQGDYMLDPSVPVLGNTWEGELVTRWRRGFEFWGADHSVATVKLHMEDALDVWPGDGVLFSDTQLLGEEQYGVSVAPGRVIARDVNCEKKTITLKALIGRESDFRMYAPSAVVSRYFENEGGVGFKLVLEDDHLDDRTSDLDVDGFAEPSYSTEGGQATIECFQFDGSAMVGGIYGTVASITSSAGSCSINLTGALTGATFDADRWTVVVFRTWGSQVAWPKRWHAPICEPDNTHTGGTAGIPFMED